MEVFVDDQRVEGDFVGDLTVAEALEQVQSGFCGPGRIVVALRCDGENIAANDMELTLARAAATLDRLDVFTGTSRSLVVDAMTQASDALEQTALSCQHIADLLTEGNSAEGIEALGQCLGVWQQINDAISRSIHMLRLDPDRMTVKGEPLMTLIGRPKDVLTQVKQALESQDHVLLADVMQYEFESVTQQWHDIIDTLKEQAEKKEEGTAEAS